MKLIRLGSVILTILSLVYCVVSLGIGEILEEDIIIKYEKRPPQPIEFKNFHEFRKSPFNSENFGAFEKSKIDESTNVTFEEINTLNEKIRPVVKNIVEANFFRIFKLNLFKECPFWQNNGFCMHRSCAVDTIDDWEKLPLVWQPDALGTIENSSLVNNLNKEEADSACDDKDYCDLDGFKHDTVYVDLVANPERFTGYGGDQSWQIWKSIYNENCFNLGHDQCIEKNFFYKIVSGMHASISTHLSNEYLNTDIMEYGPNLEQFMMRVGNFPDRIANLYLNYIVVLKSLIKLETFGVFDELSFCEDLNFVEKENEFKDEYKMLLDPALEMIDNHDVGCLFDEDILFKEKNSMIVKEEIRQNFKNITRIMDCVHCDRCRLWGKLQTTGYGTALKVLFELKDKEHFEIDIMKIELIALLNTFDRLSKSVESINKFKVMFDEALKREEEGIDNQPQSLNSIISLENSKPQKLQPPKALSKQKESKSDNQYETPQLFNKGGEVKFDEILYPDSSEDDESFKEMFISELNHVWEAVKFVVRSYYLFPKVIYNWCLVRIVDYWNRFVGQNNANLDPAMLYRVEI